MLRTCPKCGSNKLDDVTGKCQCGHVLTHESSHDKHGIKGAASSRDIVISIAVISLLAIINTYITVSKSDVSWSSPKGAYYITMGVSMILMPFVILLALAMVFNLFAKKNKVKYSKLILIVTYFTAAFSILAIATNLKYENEDTPMRRTERIDGTENKPSNDQAPLQTLISTQDAEGITQRDLTIDFLRNLETYTREQITIKAKEYLNANGMKNAKIEIKTESVYMDTGGKKLAIIRVSDSSNTSRSVLIHGIKGGEFKRVHCSRDSNEAIPLSYGPCADKIREAFDVVLAQ